jgi:Rieske 2Fe-2S family protein
MYVWPSARYTDQSAFEQETEKIFERSWMCVAHSSDVPRPGSFLTRQIGQENVLIVRNKDGVVRAMLNVCQHRGARLCLDKRGNLGKSLRCMYHVDL